MKLKDLITDLREHGEDDEEVIIVVDDDIDTEEDPIESGSILEIVEAGGFFQNARTIRVKPR